MANKFTLLPAVEVSAGQTALFEKGHVVLDRSFGDPVADAQAWIEQGATWLHLADLDAAQGAGDNRAVIEQITKAVKGRASVEYYGGVRSDADVAWARKAGATRVVLESDAPQDWLGSQFRALGHRCAVMVPVHSGRVDSGTWAGQDVAGVGTALRELGCPGVLLVDVDREGTRKGPEVELLVQLATALQAPVVAAGGIAKLEHLYALSEQATAGIAGAVLDTALYRDYFSVAEAMAAVAPRFDPYQWGPAQPWGLTGGL